MVENLIEKSCWICKEKVFFRECGKKAGWFSAHCVFCRSQTFLSGTNLASFEPLHAYTDVVMSTAEVQNFSEITLEGYTKCPSCHDQSLKYSKTKKKAKEKRRGRKRIIVGNHINCACRRCKFRCFVPKGYSKYIIGD